ncbi:MAG: 4-deoxy-4-formamido-L-arabinose-phosphoundecaprenol deformylase [Rhodocyclaceae bacterium]|nr:4-deoxy-4-formamido-L-arabinose-phosphoundecaprenol deformylase [Rhodocyclaceae bacterium]
MRQLALRITASSYRGTLQGIPNLVEQLRRHAAGATFLFSLGPDHTGCFARRLLRAGHLKQARRTRAFAHHGLGALFTGTLLPASQIGRRAAGVMRGVEESGFEVGVHGWDRWAWEEHITDADAAWTERQMRLAVDRYTEALGKAPTVHGAMGWQMNAHALRLTQRLGFRYASDTRGTHPFVPVQNGEIVLCPQLPTTLPTLEELIGLNGVTKDNVNEILLRETAAESRHPHVFSLRAEREGMKLAPVFEKLLTGWREQGYSIVAMQDIADQLDLDTLPHHQVVRGTVPGRLGTLMVQGAEFLANWKDAA